MELQEITYDCDGLSLTGYFSTPSQGTSVPGILVSHEYTGVTDHVKTCVLALAEMGFAAFALDLYGERNLSQERQMELHTQLMQTPGLLTKRAFTGLDILASQPSVDTTRLAAIGFCQGGVTSLELARAGAPILAAVGFHPGLFRPVDSCENPISAKVLMMLGSDDPLVNDDLLNAFKTEMTEKEVDWQLHIFGGAGHSFTNPAMNALNLPGFGYDPFANDRSWRLMCSLLEECFG